MREMRAASFRVAGKDGKQADVSVIPLPDPAGSDLDNVNRWRGQVGLPGVSEEELAKLGANSSLIHVDWMIGSAQMDVDGIAPNGAAEPLMRAGEWV